MLDVPELSSSHDHSVEELHPDPAVCLWGCFHHLCAKAQRSGLLDDHDRPRRRRRSAGKFGSITKQVGAEFPVERNVQKFDYIAEFAFIVRQRVECECRNPQHTTAEDPADYDPVVGQSRRTAGL